MIYNLHLDEIETLSTGVNMIYNLHLDEIEISSRKIIPYPVVAGVNGDLEENVSNIHHQTKVRLAVTLPWNLQYIIRQCRTRNLNLVSEPTGNLQHINTYMLYFR